jgi:hypothetical protein
MEHSAGVTPTERFLASIARDSFLSLWSYSNPYRDQGKLGSHGHGKELCDLLVICQNDLIIFSDKECVFPETGDLSLDWSRWYRAAVRDSASQIFGAERWIRNFPDRVFVDRECKERPHAPIPNTASARVHRVIVAHGVSAKYARQQGHSRDSLRLISRLKGDDHLRAPLAIGQVDPARGYVHVLDQGSIGTVVQELNTVTDFLVYLSWKEEIVTKGLLASAESELDLLAEFLVGRTPGLVLAGRTRLAVNPGAWDAYRGSAAYSLKVEADKVSFTIDQLIEELIQGALDGRVLPDHQEGFTLSTLERAIRWLAREPRLRRRVLGKAWADKIRETPHNQVGVRWLEMPGIGDPWYLILVMPRTAGQTEMEYRDHRFKRLLEYTLAGKVIGRAPNDILAVATDHKTRSTDVLLLERSLWGSEQEEAARAFLGGRPFFKYAGRFPVVADEFPGRLPAPVVQLRGQKPQSLNGPCPCGSGKTFKNCHAKW